MPSPRRKSPSSKAAPPPPDAPPALRPGIERDTLLMPWLVADAVVRGADFLPGALPPDLGRGDLKDGDFTGQILNEQRGLSAQETPVLLAAAADLPAHLRPVAGEEMAFRLTDIAQLREVTLRPFYELAKSRDAVYWRATTPE